MTQSSGPVLSRNHRCVLEGMQALWPHPPCFLTYTTDFSLLVAVVLSAQSTDKAVNKVMPQLIAVADTPEKMMQLGTAGLLPLIQSIGLFRRKADHIMALSQQIVENHGGHVPDECQHLVRLPGVGRKTANVVLNVLFHHPTIPVDTHVFRVARRMGFAHGTTPQAVEKELQDTIPMPWKKKIHAWFILHGRTYCHARFPKCAVCPFLKMCPFIEKSFSH